MSEVTVTGRHVEFSQFIEKQNNSSKKKMEIKPIFRQHQMTLGSIKYLTDGNVFNSNFLPSS